MNHCLTLASRSILLGLAIQASTIAHGRTAFYDFHQAGQFIALAILSATAASLTGLLSEGKPDKAD